MWEITSQCWSGQLYFVLSDFLRGERRRRAENMRAAVLCYMDGSGGPGVPVGPASRCCKGENKHSPTGLFTQGVNSNFDFILWYQGPCPPPSGSPFLPFRSFSFLFSNSVTHSHSCFVTVWHENPKIGLVKIIKQGNEQAWKPNMTVSLKHYLIYSTREGCPNLKTPLLWLHTSSFTIFWQV